MAGETPDHTPRRKLRRTWPQRLTITGAFVCAIACFGAAGVLYAGQRVVEDRNIAPTIINPATNTTPTVAPQTTTGTGTDEAGGRDHDPADVPTGRARRQELPDHRRRQQLLRRPRIALLQRVR